MEHPIAEQWQKAINKTQFLKQYYTPEYFERVEKAMANARYTLPEDAKMTESELYDIYGGPIANTIDDQEYYDNLDKHFGSQES